MSIFNHDTGNQAGVNGGEPKMRFTAQEAYDASSDGEPIMLTLWEAERIVKRHDCDMDGFEDLFSASDRIDAARLLEWLGY